MLRPDSSGLFSMALDSVRESFTYQFSYGGKIYHPDTVTVVGPPVLYSLQVNITPPKYTGSAPRALPEGQGDFTAYAGTDAMFRIKSNFLAEAWIIFDNDSSRLQIEGNRAEGNFTLWKQSSYTFALKDSFGQFNDSLPAFQTSIIPDEKPVVHFLKPGMNKNVTPALSETLWVEGIDDLGIRSMHLLSCKTGQCDSPFVWDISPAGKPRTVRKQILWDLNEYSLYPGDTLFYWIKIRDTWPFKPSRVVSSDTFWFRVPGFEEIHENIVKQEEYAEQKIGDVRKKQDNLEEMLKNVVKSATGEDQLTWDQKQILKDVKETVQAQADSLQNAMKSLEESVDRLKQEGTLGEELTEKMDQIRKSLDELIKQFGDSLLFDLKADQDISFSDMKEAVQKMEEMLPELNERLDNTLKYLQMLKRDREMAAMAMKAEKLAQEQTELGQNKDSKNSPDHQKDLLKRIDDLKKEMENPRENDPLNTPSAEAMDSLQKQMISQMSEQQMPSTGEMNKMSSTLLSLSQELRQMMSSNQMQQMQAERERMLDLAHDALSLADWQKSVMEQLQQRVDVVQLARSQQAIGEALKKSSAGVDSLKMLPPSMKQELSNNFSSAMQSSENALEALGEIDGTMAMRQNKNSLNELADKLLSTISKMDQQGSGSGSSPGGLMDGLRKLSGKQGAINAATADLLRSLMKGSQPNGSAPWR